MEPVGNESQHSRSPRCFLLQGLKTSPDSQLFSINTIYSKVTGSRWQLQVFWGKGAANSSSAATATQILSPIFFLFADHQTKDRPQPLRQRFPGLRQKQVKVSSLLSQQQQQQHQHLFTNWAATQYGLSQSFPCCTTKIASFFFHAPSLIWK